MNDDKVTAWVSVHDGKRLGWKCIKGERDGIQPMDWKYFGLGPERPPRADCCVERMVCKDWKEAEAWCASFPPHPAEGGARPSAAWSVFEGEAIKLGSAAVAEERA